MSQQFSKTYNDALRTDVKIYVEHLQIGMFVSRLDREWLGTPFLTQGFYICNKKDIDRLKVWCRWVYIHKVGVPPLVGPVVDFESGILIGRKPEKYPVTSEIKKELKEAKRISKDVKAYVKTIINDVRLGKALEGKSARRFVDKSVDSLIRHPDALMWMTRMRGVDEYTSEHCMNVCFLALIFGRKLGMKKQQLSNLGVCGLLHDIGKMRVPEEILNKPGRLTDEEMVIMRSHVVYGKQLLDNDIGVFHGAIDAAYQHHERPDGKGYPNGLKTDQIPLFTKIISIVDAYDAITGDRVYARGRTSLEALRVLYEGKGTQFDEQLVLAFIQTIGLYPPGSIVELINGVVGVVLQTEACMGHLPDVLVLLDKNKHPVDETVVSLQKTVEGELSKSYLVKKSLPNGSYDIDVKDFYERGLFD